MLSLASERGEQNHVSPLARLSLPRPQQDLLSSRCQVTPKLMEEHSQIADGPQMSPSHTPTLYKRLPWPDSVREVARRLNLSQLYPGGWRLYLQGLEGRLEKHLCLCRHRRGPGVGFCEREAGGETTPHSDVHLSPGFQHCKRLNQL